MVTLDIRRDKEKNERHNDSAIQSLLIEKKQAQGSKVKLGTNQ